MMEKYGKILGVPYDLRRPTLARVRERMWNPDDPRIITPRVFGVGWTVNFASLRKRSKAGFAVALAAAALIYGSGIYRLWRKATDLGKRAKKDRRRQAATVTYRG